MQGHVCWRGFVTKAPAVWYPANAASLISTSCQAPMQHILALAREHYADQSSRQVKNVGVRIIIYIKGHYQRGAQLL
jgi:hypothetical protein